ncbi:atrial natriuretic peptide receptor 1-like, partial [Paramuricea clavata]
MTRTPLLLLTFLQLSTAYHMGFYIPLVYGREDDATSGRAYAHALTIAMDDVNNDPRILPGHNLTYSWTNSTDSSEVVRSMYQKYIAPPNVTCDAQPTPNTPVDVFIGPADSCTAPAKVAQAFNIPMISYHCSERGNFTKDEYPLFVQTFQNTNTQAATALFTLLEKQNWTRIGVIYEEGGLLWQDVRSAISKKTSLHIIASEEVPKLLKFQQFGENFLQYPELVQRNRSLEKVREVLTVMAVEKRIKVFVLLTSFDLVVEIMAQAYTIGLTETNRPHRVFVGFQLDASKRRKNYVRQSEIFFSPYAFPQVDVMYRAMKGSRSLLIISNAEPVNTERYETFRGKLVNRTEYDPPFNSTTVYDSISKQTTISEVASSLYDAVYQYALALDRLHKRNMNVTAKAVVEELRSYPYIGIGGFPSVFTKDTGTLKIHLSLQQLTVDITRKSMRETTVKTIGNFNYSRDSGVKLKIFEQILWPWGTEHPTDQLTCVDDGYNCPEDETNVTQSIIIPTTISVVFVVIFVVLIALFVRQWKRERILKRSVWQVDISEVIFDRKISTDSKFSDDSGIRSSMQDMESLLDDTK